MTAPAPDPADLVGLDEMKDHLNIPDGSTADNAELARFITAASLVVERHTGETWALRTVVEDVAADGSGVVLLETVPVVAITSATSLDGATVYSPTLTDASNGIVALTATGTVRFTLQAGRSVRAGLPQHVVTAGKIVAAHLWRTQRPAGRATFGESPDALVAGRGYLIPNQAAQMLGGRGPGRP